MMKKAISVLLATTLCASLATPAFATAELNEVSYSFEEFKKDVDAHTITFGESTLPETEMRTSSLSSLNYDEVQKAISREHNAVVVEEAKEYVRSLNLHEAGLGFIEKSCIAELESYASLEDAQILSYTVYTPKMDNSAALNQRSSPAEPELTYLGTYQARDFYTYFPSSLSTKTNVKKNTNKSKLQQWVDCIINCTLVFAPIEVNAVWATFQNKMGAPDQYTVQTSAFTESYCNLNIYTRGVYTKFGNGAYDMVTSQQYAQTYPYMIFHPVDSPKYDEFYGHSFGYKGNVYSNKYKNSANDLCKEAWQVFYGSLVVDKFDKINTSAFKTLWD